MNLLEQQINALNTLEDREKAEPLIDRCFETGFYPWDNCAFTIFLHHTIYVNLRYPRGNFIRGLIYARHIEAIAPDNIESAGLLNDIKDWANLRNTEVFLAGSSSACNYPHPTHEHNLCFWMRLQRQARFQLSPQFEYKQRSMKLREKVRGKEHLVEQLLKRRCA